MAQKQGAMDLAVAEVATSLSDRPFAYRFAVHAGRFFRTKPLGGFGAILIAIVGTFGAAAWLADFGITSAPVDFLARVDPEAIAKGEATTCRPEQIEDPKVECFSPELLEKASTDPRVRLTYPPSRFQEGSGGGVVLTLAPSSREHWLGTDLRGRDIWSRIVHGSQLALLVGLGGAIIAVGLGTLFGVTSAYFGGWIDLIIQRITDAFFAFPALILLLIFSQVVENPSKYWNTMALGIIGVASVTRIARSSVLSAREEVYVLAARTVGASDSRIMVRHILPNILAPLIVVFTISIGAYILAEAGLAFLGLGDPTAISWGKMVNEGRALGPAKPQMALYVGTALTFTVLGFNLMGDALRDVLDPRLRGRGGRAGF